VGVILGVDGGNSKTELVAATTDGEVVAHRRGPGSNSHAIGADGTAQVIRELAGDLRPEHAVFYLCGADSPHDIAELERELAGIAASSVVDNDTFALLRVGTDRADAVAVICGSGINCVGRAANGSVARYPSLGWETGDWGGADMLAREAIFLAARAEDGRGEPTSLAQTICDHFELPSVEAVGAAVHYRRMPPTRVGEVAPLVLVAAAAGDAVAKGLVERLAREIALMAERAFRDLELSEADVVLGGGMLQPGAGVLHERALAQLPSGARPLVPTAAPVLGAALAALDAAGASDRAKARLRAGLDGR
jgi:N-acetylglucosamine kinase-like BadF-type ATPase